MPTVKRVVRTSTCFKALIWASELNEKRNLGKKMNNHAENYNFSHVAKIYETKPKIKQKTKWDK